jgi:hypothetical protein
MTRKNEARFIDHPRSRPHRPVEIRSRTACPAAGHRRDAGFYQQKRPPRCAGTPIVALDGEDPIGV